MKIILLIFLLNITYFYYSQVNDNFEDADFTANPTWFGDDSVFTVINDVGSFKLRSNKLLPNSSYYLSTASSSVLNTQWEFDVKLSFNTSGANYVDIFLVSDQSNLMSLNLNGYFVRIGNSNDEISLYKIINGISTIIIDGTNAVTNTSNNNLKVKVICSNNNEWSLERDVTATGQNYVLEGSTTDNTFTNSQYFGIFIKHSTVSFIQKHYFDNFYIGPIITDNTPPNLVSLNLLSNTQLDVLFSENLSLISAENINNYSFNPSITIQTATQDLNDKKLVHLTFTNPVIANTLYTISCSGIQDLYGNSSQSESLTFMNIVSDTPQSGDVIINEFMCDPSPIVGLPDAEFIEIYNKSNKIFNIKKWKIGDSSTEGNISESLLLPGEYRVLCSSGNIGLFTNSLSVSSFPSLNNSGDDIVLKDSLGNVIDKITYDLTWYHDITKEGGGYTIEKINPESVCGGASNWSASTNVLGGTPGVINSIFSNLPDTQAPEISTIQILNTNEIQINFNEYMDSLSLANSQIIFDPSITVNSKTIVGQYPISMILTFSSDLILNQTYSILMLQVSDCSQNVIDVSSNFSISSGANFNDIVINEFICDPSPSVGLPEVEFVEIYNKSNKIINLKKWKIGDNSSDGTISDAVIMPNEYKVLCSNSNVSLFSNSIGVTSFPSLNNAGDDIVIKDSLGIVIDKITYDDTWYQDNAKKDGGYSLERINPIAKCTPSINWLASNNQNGGTPGVQNSVFDTLPDLTPPAVLSIEVIEPNFISITFNEKMDSLSLITSNIEVQPNIGIIGKYLSETNPQSMLIEFSTNFVASQVYTLYLPNVLDCSQNLSTLQVEFVLADKAKKGDLIINEILFNPKTGGSDFIELKNISNKVINLSSLSLANFSNDTISSIKKLTTIKTIEKNDFIVITPDSNYVKLQYPYCVQGKFIQQSIPSYNDDSSTVYLLNDSIILDKVSYSKKWHFSLLNDLEGKTLERINPNLPSDDSNNWHTASSSYQYGTPTIENSQLMMGEYNGEVNLTNQTLSPDNDGFEDFLQINYSSLEPSMLANINIYDDRGLKVHVLASNKYLGNSGSLTWNGLNDKNEKLSIGVYVLMFEAFTANGSLFTKKIPFVIAGKE